MRCSSSAPSAAVLLEVLLLYAVVVLRLLVLLMALLLHNFHWLCSADDSLRCCKTVVVVAVIIVVVAVALQRMQQMLLFAPGRRRTARGRWDRLGRLFAAREGKGTAVIAFSHCLRRAKGRGIFGHSIFGQKFLPHRRWTFCCWCPPKGREGPDYASTTGGSAPRGARR